jgi:hypothetical protein
MTNGRLGQVGLTFTSCLIKVDLGGYITNDKWEELT